MHKMLDVLVQILNALLLVRQCHRPSSRVKPMVKISQLNSNIGKLSNLAFNIKICFPAEAPRSPIGSNNVSQSSVTLPEIATVQFP